jgi:hypothetical protein
MKSAGWMLFSTLPLWCALGAGSGQAQAASDVVTESVFGQKAPVDSAQVLEEEETANGMNFRLNPQTITLPDPRTGTSDTINVSLITGIITSDAPVNDPDQGDLAENDFGVLTATFRSPRQLDTLTVAGVRDANGKPIVVTGESGTFKVPERTRTIGDDSVFLNAFTISFISDTGREMPNDPAEIASPLLTITLSSDGGVSTPEPTSLALLSTGLLSLGLILRRRQPC